jgi:hypothetical protein
MALNLAIDAIDSNLLTGRDGAGRILITRDRISCLGVGGGGLECTMDRMERIRACLHAVQFKGKEKERQKHETSERSEVYQKVAWRGRCLSICLSSWSVGCVDGWTGTGTSTSSHLFYRVICLRLPSFLAHTVAYRML